MLTRSLNMEIGKLHDEFIIVRTYYFDVIHDIILHGFMYNNEKYVCFTASAGQIRNKKTVFIKESIWNQYKRTLMCGLTEDIINENGGININKYLAYLALCNSATDYWDDFDIKKTIVVDDMETMVSGLVDFIDHNTYEISRKNMDIPINHTDGCGMVLPSSCNKNTMVRLPWVKGLLAVFPFDKFIKNANKLNPSINHAIIKDIYGKEHDILKEDIQIIFTKSQFKMHKYYRDWNDYIQKYIDYNCSAGKCNEEEDFLPDAKLNYQMLQTLTDITDDELANIALPTINKISNIATDKDTMLDVFGASAQFRNKNSFQKCLQLYPELLSDSYTKDMLKLIKKRLVCEGRAAKLNISAKYMFLIPDLYAFCEFLFMGNKNPTGLLKDGEVSCYLYRNIDKLDCLRSPHLYREHAVRKNIVNSDTRKWFSKNAIYTSCHDLISKMLQFDCDGDKSLVCADAIFVNIAERNMKDVVPLYYKMAKAGCVQITNDAIFDGLKAAWSGGNIGEISNDITKIWNSEKIDIDAIKILCMENNFCIDYAKTLYKPERPSDINTRLSKITSLKTPHFFIYAKQKESKQVQQINNSVINRLNNIIPNKRLSFSAKNIGSFKHTYMMSDKNIEIQQDIIDLYNDVEKQYRYSVAFYDDTTNLYYIRDSVINKFLSLGYEPQYICDVLIKYLFSSTQSKRKNVFWLCFGDIVLRNLNKNIPKGSIQCKKCGNRFIPTVSQQKICKECSAYKPIKKRQIKCIDCGVNFEVYSIVKNKKRCNN